MDDSAVSQHLVHRVVDTREDLVEDGVRNILEDITSWIPFLKDENGIVKPIKATSIKRLTIATSNKSFKCKYIVDESRKLENVEEKSPKQSGSSDAAIRTALEVNGVESDRVYVSDNDDYVIVRVYGKGSDLLVDRKHELRMIRHFSELELGPKLYATFDNGYAAEYVKGRMLEPEEFQDPYFYNKVAAKVAQVHRVEAPPTVTEGGVWKLLRHWMEVAQNLYTPSTFDQITKEIEEVESALSRYKNNLCLTHNDLNHGNFIYNPKTETLTLVDFEASDFSDRGFDLGNHFCEWAGLDLNFENYPKKETQMEFLRQYLASYKGISLGEVSQEELEELYAEANKYSLVSHLLWYVWSKIQAKISDIPYFNYEEYGLKRMDRYYKTKEMFLKL